MLRCSVARAIDWRDYSECIVFRDIQAKNDGFRHRGVSTPPSSSGPVPASTVEGWVGFRGSLSVSGVRVCLVVVVEVIEFGRLYLVHLYISSRHSRRWARGSDLVSTVSNVKYHKTCVFAHVMWA